MAGYNLGDWDETRTKECGRNARNRQSGRNSDSDRKIRSAQSNRSRCDGVKLYGMRVRRGRFSVVNCMAGRASQVYGHRAGKFVGEP